MVDAIETRKNWIRKFCAILIGLFVTGMIFFILPKSSKMKKVEKNKSILKNVYQIKPIIKKKDKTEFKKNNKITLGCFKKYRITLEIEFKEDTEVKKALGDFKKVSYIIKSSPSINKLIPVSAKGIKKKDGEIVEYDIDLNFK